MIYLWSALYLLLTVVQYALLIRIVFDVVQSFVRGWKPRGIALLIGSIIYSVTDRPLRSLRSKIPPLNLGGIGFDVAFLILFVVVMLLKSVTVMLAQATF